MDAPMFIMAENGMSRTETLRVQTNLSRSAAMEASPVISDIRGSANTNSSTESTTLIAMLVFRVYVKPVHIFSRSLCPSAEEQTGIIAEPIALSGRLTTPMYLQA